MTPTEITTIALHLIDGGHTTQQVSRALAYAVPHSDDADDCLALALGAITGAEGDRYGVMPGTVRSMIDGDA